MTQSQFIQHLKRQPRIGLTSQEIQEIFNAISNSAKGAKEILEQNLSAFINYNAELAKFTNSSDFTSYLTGVEKQIAVNEILNQKFQENIDRSLFLEKRNKELNKTFGASSKAAARMSQELAKMAEKLGVSSTQAITYATNIKSIIPVVNVAAASHGKFYKSLVVLQKQLTTNFEMTAEQAESYSYYASQTEKGAVTQLEATRAAALAIEESTGMTGAFKDIVSEIAAAGNDTQLQFGRIPGSIELASMKAKSLGFTLDQMAQSGKQMLDIESSIGKELEYQLLSGHRLVDQDGKSLTNTIREAQLKGDMNAQMDAMNTLLEQEGDVLENNMIARQNMADLLGIDEKSLSKAIQKKKMLASMGVDEELFKLSGDALTDAAQVLVKNGEINADQFDEIIAAGEDQRTTDQLIEEQNAIAEDNRMANFLQLDQADMQAMAAFEAVQGNARLQGQLMNMVIDGNEGVVAGIGRATRTYETGKDVTSVSNLTDQVLNAKTKKSEKQDFMIRSSGEVIDFTSDDDVIGAKKDGPIDKMLNGGNGGVDFDYNKLGQAVATAVSNNANFKVHLKVDPKIARFLTDDG